MSAPVEDAFQKALERAKAVANKLTGTIPGKRSIEEDGGSDTKRAQLSDPFGAQLAASKQGLEQPRADRVYPEGIVANGEKTLDMMIPATKVGYVIGKGGEMIRTLQDRANVKMTVIQSTSEVTGQEKQLRIVGDPSKVDYAVQLVNDLLTEKEIEIAKLKNKSKEASLTNEYGSARQISREVPVPPQFIGLVIGKGGESIKSIQSTTNTKVQFDSNRVDDNGCKICKITGDQENVRRAEQMIQEIIENSRNSQQHSGDHNREHHGYDRDRDRDMGRDRERGDSRGGGRGGRMGGSGERRRFEGEEVMMNVPSNKVGVIIGRGGETIRAIKQQSGCHIETDKNSKGVMIIRGPPDRIALAQQLINEKVKESRLNERGGGGFGRHGADDDRNNQYQHLNQPQMYSERNYTQHPQSHQPTSQHPQHPQQSNPQMQQQYWPGYYYPENSQNSNDSTSQDPNNSAEWAAYYQAQRMASQISGATGTQNGSDQPQQDYTAQWIQYYRAYGMHKEAEMIEQMAEQMKQQQAVQQPGQPPKPPQQWNAPQDQSSEAYKFNN